MSFYYDLLKYIRDELKIAIDKQNWEEVKDIYERIVNEIGEG